MKRLFVLLLAWSVASAAEAQSEPHVVVSDCPGIEPSELSRLLAIELRTLDPVIVTRVREVQVQCHGDDVAVAALPDDQSSPLEVSFSLSAAERGSLARLVALRISEQLTQAPPAPPPPPPAKGPPPPAKGPPPPAPAPPVEPEPVVELPHARGAIAVSALTRRLGTPATWLGGVDVGYLAQLPASLALQADVDFALGDARTDLAEVSWRELGLAVALLARLRTPHADAGIGPGFRATFAWLSPHAVGSGHAGRDLAAAWAGPLLLAQLGLHGRSPWQALLGIEAGIVVAPIEGSLDDTRTLLSISGLWLSARAGTAYRW
jgi:hypothetical protein